MRIADVRIPEDFGKNGLRQITMTGLGPMVLLVGANGSGKTRLLRLLETVASQHMMPEPARAAEESKTALEAAIKEFQEQQARAPLPEAQAKAHYQRLEQQLMQTETALLRHHMLTTGPGTGPLRIVPFVPSAVDLTRAEQMPEETRVHSAAQIENIQGAPTATLSYIRIVQDEYFNATHPKSAMSPEERAAAEERHARLNGLVTDLLGTELGRDAKSRTLLFGLPPESVNLSQGQVVLLQLAAQLHARSASIADAIVVLDEPESHLHPKALVEVFDRLCSVVTGGQIWVATHSIHLVAEAHKHQSAIWYMERGSVSYAGSTPERVLAGLLGVGEHGERLADLLTLPAAIAAVQFAAESLSPPGIAEHRSEDPQTQHIVERITAVRPTGKALRVLDFGAGKARLLAALAEAIGPDCKTLFDYIAYEPGSELHAEIESRIVAVYGTSSQRLARNRDELERLDDSSIDVAVLCNVLHEIDPRQWLAEFGPDSLLARKLSENGFLMIVEDQLMPVGEKSHRLGFVVLHGTAVRKLFAAAEADTDMVESTRREGRLAMFLVPRRLMARASADTRSQALKSVAARAIEEISRIRKQAETSRSITYRDGRRHALFLQLLANAQLASSEG